MWECGDSNQTPRIRLESEPASRDTARMDPSYLEPHQPQDPELSHGCSCYRTQLMGLEWIWMEKQELWKFWSGALSMPSSFRFPLNSTILSFCIADFLELPTYYIFKVIQHTHTHTYYIREHFIVVKTIMIFVNRTDSSQLLLKQKYFFPLALETATHQLTSSSQSLLRNVRELSLYHQHLSSAEHGETPLQSKRMHEMTMTNRILDSGPTEGSQNDVKRR